MLPLSVLVVLIVLVALCYTFYVKYITPPFVDNESEIKLSSESATNAADKSPSDMSFQTAKNALPVAAMVASPSHRSLGNAAPGLSNMSIARMAVSDSGLSPSATTALIKAGASDSVARKAISELQTTTPVEVHKLVDDGAIASDSSSVPASTVPIVSESSNESRASNNETSPSPVPSPASSMPPQQQPSSNASDTPRKTSKTKSKHKPKKVKKKDKSQDGKQKSKDSKKKKKHVSNPKTIDEGEERDKKKKRSHRKKKKSKSKSKSTDAPDEAGSQPPKAP